MRNTLTYNPHALNGLRAFPAYLHQNKDLARWRGSGLRVGLRDTQYRHFAVMVSARAGPYTKSVLVLAVRVQVRVGVTHVPVLLAMGVDEVGAREQLLTSSGNWKRKFLRR